ncbi:MAG: hypothetical protein ABI639_06765 [Thermoanaerobaculia bacterium]
MAGKAGRARLWAMSGAGALVVGLLFAQPTETPLARLDFRGDKLGWDDVTLGMSVVQVERRVDGALGMTRAPDGAAVSACEAYTVDVERGTLRLTLGFPSAKPGAKLQSIFVRFEGYQISARRAALVTELKGKLPGAKYVALSGASAPAEADDPAPAYLLPGKAGLAVRLTPGEGIRLTLRDCLN